MTTYFITICAHMQQNLFQRDQVAQLMVATFFKYRDAGEFELHDFVVMPNHIHLLFSTEQKLSRVIQLIKGGFSHSLRKNGIVFRAVWEQRYYDRQVREENEFAEFARYIRESPVRKGLVERAEEYPYSSVGVSGLKPLEGNRGDRDASLKARSTDPSESEGSGLKPPEENRRDGHASLKVRSTDPSGNAGNASLKVRFTGLATC